MAASNPLTKILDANRLTGPNFSDWLRNLRIILNSEKIAYILTTPAPELPADDNEEERAAYEKWIDDDNRVRCYMLASMSNELQRQHEHMNSASAILLHLQELYGEQSRSTGYEISKRLFRARMFDGQSVNHHCLKMIEDIEELPKLGLRMDADLQTDLILQSLPDSFSQFIMNFQMNKIQCTLSELLNMLVTAEGTIKGNNGVDLAMEGFILNKRKSK
ncbi:uncharacterized protein LOC109706190 [Ananas comosus]|uniref:Uncharacterized protein LOC109706190 n=1 Tax=Ananas comosus TaxID=4615 RepID=A0A6P5EGX9_ANACO|nr:uncharacterized protein LOC109706190 [Ananas comosus]